MAGEGAINQRAGKHAFKAAAKAPSAGAAGYGDAKQDRQVQVNSVMNLGSRSFYRREGKWIDSRVTDKMRGSVNNIKRYSDEYFALIDKHGKDVAKYLAIDEPVVLELDGKAYEF